MNVPGDWESSTQCSVSAGEDEKVLKMAGGSGYRRMWMNPNCTLKNDYHTDGGSSGEKAQT